MWVGSAALSVVPFPPRVRLLSWLCGRQAPFVAAVEPHVSPERLSEEGNQWVKRMLKMPRAMVTGGVDDTAALADGTFSDEVHARVQAP